MEKFAVEMPFRNWTVLVRWAANSALNHLHKDLERRVSEKYEKLFLMGRRIGFRNVDARTLIRDMHDIAVSTRSTCFSGSTGPSHVLKALGLTDDQAYSCIRFSLGRFTPPRKRSIVRSRR
jgi:cysteine sulfinate desulfinase/cysteine desulfurase-like protein